MATFGRTLTTALFGLALTSSAALAEQGSRGERTPKKTSRRSAGAGHAGEGDAPAAPPGTLGKAVTPKGRRPAPRPHAEPAAAEVAPEDPVLAGLLNRLAMLSYAREKYDPNEIPTGADQFIEDTARWLSRGTAQSALWELHDKDARTFKTPKDDGSVIVMFGDGSGAYVHPDGFVTPMGKDIRAEVARNKYPEIPTWKARGF